MRNPEETPIQPEQPPTQTSPEDAIEAPKLKEIFPRDNRDLDSLFPEEEIRVLFRDVVGGLAEVDKFVQRIDRQLKTERETDEEPIVPLSPSFL